MVSNKSHSMKDKYILRTLTTDGWCALALEFIRNCFFSSFGAGDAFAAAVATAAAFASHLVKLNIFSAQMKTK